MVLSRNLNETLRLVVFTARHFLLTKKNQKKTKQKKLKAKKIKAPRLNSAFQVKATETINVSHLRELRYIHAVRVRVWVLKKRHKSVCALAKEQRRAHEMRVSRMRVRAFALDRQANRVQRVNSAFRTCAWRTDKKSNVNCFERNWISSLFKKTHKTVQAKRNEKKIFFANWNRLFKIGKKLEKNRVVRWL